MAEYKGIKGFKVQTVSTDPAAINTQEERGLVVEV
jgi:hypothetical protein